MMRWREMSRKRKQHLVLGVFNLALSSGAVILNKFYRQYPELLSTEMLLFLVFLLIVSAVNVGILLLFKDGKP